MQLLNGAVLLDGKKHRLPFTKEYVLEAYSDVFNRVGTFTGKEYHIMLKKSHVPVQHHPRSVPVKIKAAYKEELQQLYDEGITTPVQEHTE